MLSLFRFYLYVTSILAERRVELSIESHGAPDLYVNEALTFTCTASGFTDIQGVALKVVNGSSETALGCNRTASNESVLITSSLLQYLSFGAYADKTRSYLSAYACDYLAARFPAGYSVFSSGMITAELVGMKFYCEAWGDNVTLTDKDKLLEILELKGKLFILE